MIVQSLQLALFLLLFLLIQIVVLEKGSFDDSFLKKGKAIKVSLGFIAITTLVIFVVFSGLTGLYLRESPENQALYSNVFLSIIGIFFLLFITLKNNSLLRKFLLSIAVASLFVSLVLFSGSILLKNILTAASLLWISFLCFRYLKIKRIYILVFMELFMAFDIYNVLILNPTLQMTGYPVLLNRFIEFGSYALGMGDFFLGFLALGLVWSDRGLKRSVILAGVIATLLLVVNVVGFKHDIPFSVFIVVPTLIVYFWKEIKK